MLCTEIVSDIENSFCTQHVLHMLCQKKSFRQRFTCTEEENEDELELEENQEPEEEEVHSEYQKSDIGKSGKHIQTCTL